MQIHVNGQVRDIPDGSTVLALIESLGYAGKRVAVERNGDIVPKSLHGRTALHAGDRLEIVAAVGGG